MWVPYGIIRRGSSAPVSVLNAFAAAATSQAALETGEPLPFAGGDVSAGSNRVLVAIILYRAATITLPTGMTLGGQNMTQINSDILAAGQDIGVDAWIINDAGIVSAGADPEIDANGSAGGGTNFRCYTAAFENVDQTTPVNASDANSVSSPEATIASLANQDGGRFIGGWIADTFQAPDANASWTNATETLDNSGGSAYFSISEAATDGSNIAVSVASDGTDSILRNGLIGFTLNPA